MIAFVCSFWPFVAVALLLLGIGEQTLDGERGLPVVDRWVFCSLKRGHDEKKEGGKEKREMRDRWRARAWQKEKRKISEGETPERRSRV